MTNDPMELLRTIHRALTGISLRLDDMTASSHRHESELGAVRGSLSALRREINDVTQRGFDHEIRLRQIEAEFGGGDQVRSD
jgi:hypothetical protein